MFVDNSLAFSSNWQTAQSLIVSTNTASTNTIDVTGAGSGNAPSVVWGTSSTFGADMGIGGGETRPHVRVQVTTAFTTGTSATLNIALQSAPDNGSNAPGTWTTCNETGPLAASALTVGTAINLDFGPRAPGAALPRFYRLLYQLPGSTSFTAGAVVAGVVVNNDSSTTIGQYPVNFTAY